MDMSRNIHANICWKNILRNPPAGYLPFLLSYILVPLVPNHFLGTVSALVSLTELMHTSFSFKQMRFRMGKEISEKSGSQERKTCPQFCRL